MFGDADTHWPPLTPTTVAVHDDGNGPSHLTKKQKQRVKEQQRLKLKKAQEAAGPVRKSWYDISEEPSRDYDDEDVQSSVSSSASGGDGADGNANGTSAAAAAPAGPQEMMRSELMTTYGYPPEEIDAAMEKMFELGLPYDDAEEVDAFLRLEKVKELSTAASAGREAVSAGTESQSRDKESQTPTLPSTPPDDSGSREEEADETKEEEEEVEEPAISGGDDVGDDAATAEADDDEISDKGTVQATAPAAAVKARQVSIEPKNVTTASNAAGGNGSSGDVVVGVLARLDMVSKANNLDDAIFALTEWVDKVATPTEVSMTRDVRYLCPNFCCCEIHPISLSTFIFHIPCIIFSSNNLIFRSSNCATHASARPSSPSSGGPFSSPDLRSTRKSSP